ncbi:MAG TPA: nucleoside phosphorylase [Bacteroidales bacterium]|nr:nucleoside phosphorylase [Bacteroidales bacterium]HPT52583.1 nucleoside phosphorylase [Bacteroidales bacterium]
MNKIPASELPLQAGGQIYHLGVHPDEIADHIIVVGDPGRVEAVSKNFDTVDFKHTNRELVTHTGTLRGKRITALSTGMGTDNIDIVLNELDALANIDLKTMTVKPEHRTLNIIRIGTCGALQPEIKVNSFIAAAYGFGFDGLLHFYEYGNLSDEKLVEAFVKQTGWNERLPYPYCIPANTELLNRIAFDMVQGVTASAPGFFGPQGRQVRAQLKYPHLNEKIEQFDYQGKKITNLEMETSALYGLGKLFGHNTLTVCVAIANRVSKDFSKDYKPYVTKLIETVLERIF